MPIMQLRINHIFGLVLIASAHTAIARSLNGVLYSAWEERWELATHGTCQKHYTDKDRSLDRSDASFGSHLLEEK